MHPGPSLPKIVHAVERLSATPDGGEVWVAEPSPCSDIAVNQFVVFLKPEVTAGRFAGVCEMVLTTLADHAIDVHAVRVLNGTYIGQTRMMESHYGVINEISRLGEAAIPPIALRDRFPDGEVLGGHQFLERFPQFSALALATLFANVENVRLASGTHAGEVSVLGRKIVLLNGFHPFQLERFTRPDAVVVALECRTATPWTVLRRQVAGATDSAAAVPGSIRRTLFDRSAEFGVSGRSNGFHLSAGPLEGLVEMRRFFGDETTTFDRLLLGRGLSAEQVSWLSGNPVLSGGTAFAVTEELDAADAATTLQRQCNPRG
jgi:hypothetical protein